MAVSKADRKAMARAGMGKPPAAPPQKPELKDEAATAANANGKTHTEETAASEPPATPVPTPQSPAEAPKDAMEPTATMSAAEMESTLLEHEDRLDNVETEAKAAGELAAEAVAALNKMAQEGQSPAEKRLSDLFELRLKSAGQRLGQEVGSAAAQAVERSTLSLTKAGEALGKAHEAVQVAQQAAESVDQVVQVANEALDNISLVKEAVEEMRQIGEFVAETKETMNNLAEEMRAEMAALREEIATSRSASLPTPQPAPPVEVVEEPAKKLRPWQKA